MNATSASMTHTPAQMYSVKDAAKPKSTSLVTATAKAMMGVASNKSALTQTDGLPGGLRPGCASELRPEPRRVAPTMQSPEWIIRAVAP